MVRKSAKDVKENFVIALTEVKMNIYIVVCDDRHDDLEFHAFTDEREAITEARKIAKDYSDGRDYRESHDTGFLFYATYTGEGDSVIVVKTELNEKSNND